MQGVVIFPRAPWDRMEICFFSWRWRCHSVLTAFLWRSYGDLGVSTELQGVARPLRSYGVVGDLTALLRQPRGDPTALLSGRRSLGVCFSMHKVRAGDLCDLTAFTTDATAFSWRAGRRSGSLKIAVGTPFWCYCSIKCRRSILCIRSIFWRNLMSQLSI